MADGSLIMSVGCDEVDAWQARIAAEVAARYGVPVSPHVVSRAAPGASGIPPLKWDGKALVYDAPVSPWRAAARREFSSRAHAIRVSTGPSLAVQHRRDELARLHALGMYDAQIMAQMGVSLGTVRNMRYALGLESNGQRAQQAVAAARVARIMDMLVRGVAPGVIAAREGIRQDSVQAIGRERLGMSFAANRSVKLVARVEAAQKAAIARAIARADAHLVEVQRRDAKRKADLAARRAAVAELAATGLSQRDIAQRLGVSRKTVADDAKAVGAVLQMQRGRYYPRIQLVENLTARRANVLRLLQSGQTATQISRALGHPKSTVRGDCKALIASGAFDPFTAPPPPWEQRQAEVLVLLQRGMERQDIARTLGVSVSTIRDDRAALIQSGAFQSATQQVAA